MTQTSHTALTQVSSLPAPWQAAVNAALTGDAFGVPHEFKSGSNLPHKKTLEMVMPAAYPKTYKDIPYGVWSDDGSQMLALLDALITGKGQFSSTVFGNNLLAWLYDARFQVGGVVFDCGMQTRVALETLARGEPLQFSESHCGNGSLMRVLPVAAVPDLFGISKRDAIIMAMSQSDVTHPQILARVCCALYIELAWLAQSGRHGLRALLPEAAQALLARGVLRAEEESALIDILAYGEKNMPTNSGYVVNSLWSALWAIDRSDSLSDTLRNVVCLGGDTDTVACIAAGLASLVHGWDEKSKEWAQQMWHRAEA